MTSRSRIQAGGASVTLGVKDKLQTGLNKARHRISKFGKSVSGLGKVYAGVGGGVLASMAPAVAIFTSFDDAIRQVKAVTGATGADFEMLRNKAKELGRTTSFTASEVAGLMIELGRAGFKPDSINDMAGAVLDLAKATGTDATLASGTLAASLNQFGLGAGDAVRVADALTVAANNSFNSVESLSKALEYAGPVAQDMGMDFEETLAILGGLGNVGIQGTSAGNALKRLSVISGAEADSMKKLFGVDFKDAAGNARPLAVVLDEVNASVSDLGTADRAKKFKEAFGLLGITAASAIGKSSTSISDLQDKLDNASGSAKQTATEMEAGLGGSFRKLYSAVEGVAIAVGEALSGPLNSLAEWVTKAAGWVTMLAEKNGDLIRVVGMVALGVTGFGLALMAAGAAASVIAFAVGGLATAVGFLGSLIGTLFSPLVLLGGLLVAGAGYFLFFTEAGQNSLSWFSSEFSKLSDIFDRVFGGIKDALTSGDLETAGRIAFTGLKLAAATVLDSIVKLVAERLDAAFLPIQVMIGKAAQMARNAGLTGTANGLMAIAAGLDVSSGLGSALSGSLVDSIQKDLDALTEKAKQGAEEVKAEAIEIAAAVGAKNSGSGGGPKLPPPPEVKALKDAFSNFTSLSASAALRSGPAAKKVSDKILEENKKQTDHLEAIRNAADNGGLEFA
jgi:TP901 family phage tail tape measure protein